MKNNIILVGMMGSGKSTVAKYISKEKLLTYIDTDDLIEVQEKQSIAEIFKLKGENHFRDLEARLIENLDCVNSLISTGGGMIISSENRTRLRALGTVIYLRGDVQTLFQRLVNQTDTRPLLEQTRLMKQLEQLLDIREDLYEATAHRVVDIAGKDLMTICEEIYGILIELGYKFP